MSRLWAAVGSIVGAGVGAVAIGYLRDKRHVTGISQDDAELYGAVGGSMIGAAVGAGYCPACPTRTGIAGVGEPPRIPLSHPRFP